MHYYRHHIGDFARDTSRLSDSQCVAYLRMIWMYYEDETPLEDDPEAIAFKIGANASDVHQILKHFFFLHEGRWHQARCDQEIVAFRSKSDKAKDSANARWKNATAMRTHTERNAGEYVFDANHKPLTTNQENNKNNSPSGSVSFPKDRKGYTEDFEEAWESYPKRPGANKKESHKAWSARLRSGVDPQVIIDGVKRYAAYCESSKTEPMFIKQPATFFGPGEHYLSDWKIMNGNGGGKDDYDIFAGAIN